MTKIYMFALVGGMIFGAYITGTIIAREKCQTKIAQSTTEQIKINTINKRKINETVYRTRVHDIRDILHAKYSIAE